MANEASSCGNCEQLRRQLEEKDKQIMVLLSQIAELGRKDEMTGALNRRSWEEMLASELQRAQRTGHPFCVAVMRLDNFQSVAGTNSQALLKTVSDTALRILRTIDRVGHFEAGTFGILLPATWLDQGGIAMRRLSEGIANCQPGLALSFSAGLTTNAFGDTVQVITQRATNSMEQAAQQGGNRVVQTEEALPDAPLPG